MSADTGPDDHLATLTPRQLLQLSRNIIIELQDRGLASTGNSPIADIAEHIVAAARGGRIADNSNKAVDVVCPDDPTLQVKAMGPRVAGTQGKFGVIRSLNFTSCVFIRFGDTYELAEAHEVTPDALSDLPVNKHVNGRAATLGFVRIVGADITDEMAAAYERINER